MAPKLLNAESMLSAAQMLMVMAAPRDNKLYLTVRGGNGDQFICLEPAIADLMRRLLAHIAVGDEVMLLASIEGEGEEEEDIE